MNRVRFAHNHENGTSDSHNNHDTDIKRGVDPKGFPKTFSTPCTETVRLLGSELSRSPIFRHNWSVDPGEIKSEPIDSIPD